ncbi:MAG: tetratricopeptide repeat protein [Thermoanaerobaculia bacterium]|nr:tetratricopeptide repeat protein [Thermoanaerobaculia bacterium]
MRKKLWTWTLAGALPVLAAGALWAAGAPSSSSVTAQDPQAAARESYDRGLKYRDKAWELEEALAAGEGDAEKLEKKIEKEYRKAIRAYEAAVQNDPAFYQAHASLGYALRKVGEFEESLEAYDRALEIEPRYGRAIEYRAEAYLGLGRIEEAKEAYMTLFRGDRELASQLLTAMRKWIETRREDPHGIDAESLEAFAGWVEERAELAEQASLTPADAGAAWTSTR